MLHMHEDLRHIKMTGQRTIEQLPPVEALGPLQRRGIATAGISAARAGFTFVRPSPWHDTLLVASAGVGQVLVDGEWSSCAAGQAYWAPAGTRHAYHWERGTWQLAWVTTWPERFPVRLAVGSGPALADAVPEPLTGLVRHYCAEACDRAEPAVLEPLAELVAVALRRLTVVPRRLDALWARVDESLASRWSLQDLACVAGLSAGHLRAVCLRERGEPPVRHLARRRLQRAATLLVSTSDTVERVAHAVGYSNAFAFSTAFRRAYGRSPGGYRCGTVPPEGPVCPDAM